MRRLAATILFGLLLAAASVERASAEAPFGEWTIAGIAGDPVTGGPTLAIESTGYSGSSGCNRYFGNIIVEGPAISFGPPGATRMMCADRSLMEQETALFAALTSVKTWQASGNELHLFDEAGVPVVVLLAATAPDAANLIVIPVPDTVTVESRSYRCGGLLVKVDFIDAGPVALALLHFPRETIVAANVLFAQGTRYAGGRYVLWLHGTVELLDAADTGPGRWVPCTPVAAAAP
jgi:heat shock protein HslJ/membrane-bound inhibitor of C-type lysozyme